MKFKKIVLLLLAVGYAVFTYAQPRFKYKVQKVGTDIYMLETDDNDNRWGSCNIAVIINEEDVFVVDSGLLPSAGEDAISEIRKLTKKPVRFLVNTHWHGDHWQGNSAFAKAYPGLQIITSEQNQIAIERNGMVWLDKHYIRRFSQSVTSYEETLKNEKEGKTNNLNAEQERLLEEGTDGMKKDLEEMKTVKAVFPNTTFTDKLIIRSGSREIQLHYLGVGNTIGDVIAYLPKEKILIAGDMVVHPSPYESGAFSSDWIQTSQKLMDNFAYDKLIPGHGSVQNDTIYLSFLNTLFREIAKQADAAYRSGQSKLEDVQAVVTYKTVTDELNKNATYRQHTEKLTKGFVNAALKSSFSALINGEFNVLFKENSRKP